MARVGNPKGKKTYPWKVTVTVEGGYTSTGKKKQNKYVESFCKTEEEANTIHFENLTNGLKSFKFKR